jgi:outer membrane protein assembly factor BamA
MTLFLLGHSGVAGAQSASTITDSASRILSADTLKSAKKESDTATGWAGAPYVEYAPETRLVGGFVAIYFFHFRGDSGASASRPSSFSGGGSYTQKHQFSSAIDYDFYFAHDVYHWLGGLDYKRIPFDFFGVGDHNALSPTDSYTPLWRGGDYQVTRIFSLGGEDQEIEIGVGGELRSDKILSSNDGGPLKTASVPGATGGMLSGFGLVVNYDTRDNIYSSRSGDYASFNAYAYNKIIGSTFNFARYSLDVRHFIPVFKTHVLALQALVTIADGVEPFYAMAGLGGDVNMRGYYEGRFLDNDMAVIQAEYRLPIYWRFSFAAFADVGEVAGVLHQFDLPGLKYSVGAGIRFAIVPDERLNVRLDYGIGNDSQELYFSILEAF